MATPVPYRWITGLEPKAQQEIERNFLHLQKQIVPAGGQATIFDAVINPNIAANDPTNHIYQNLAGVVAGEPSWTALKTFVVGVLQTSPGLFSVDGAAIALPGPLTLFGVGNKGRYIDADIFTEYSRSAMDIRGQITASVALGVTLINVEIFSAGGAPLPLLFNSNVTLTMLNSSMDGQSSGGITAIGCGILYGFGSAFYGLFPQAVSNTYLWDVGMTWGPLASATINTTSFSWIGGLMNAATGGGVVTLSITGGGRVHLEIMGVVDTGWSSSVGGSIDLSISNTGGLYFKTNQIFRDIVVGPGTGDCYFDMSKIRKLTVQGNNNLKDRFFKVTCSIGTTGPVLDFTGPGKIDAILTGTGAAATFRGNQVNADVYIAAGPNPAVACVGLDDSLIRAVITDGGLGAQAYTIDAASTRVLLLFAGIHAANFTTASTNAGTDCQVVTELGAETENWRVMTIGKGLRVKEGTNAKQGVATLVAGAVVVANTSVTANSRILLTTQVLGTVAAPKAIAVTARTAGTSFTITSADGTDTSTVAWEIFEPA